MSDSRNARDDGRLGSIRIGAPAFVAEGGEEVGAVRDLRPDGDVDAVENADDFDVRAEALGRADDAEEQGL